MSRGKWLGRWFKLYDNFDDPKFWTSKIDNEELGAWLRLLSIASQSKPKGLIQPVHGLVLTVEQVNGLIKTKKAYIDKWEKQGAIKIIKGVINIVNWYIYQNEQDRKDGYKAPLNRPLKSPVLDVDVDVDVYVDVDKDNKKKKEQQAEKAPACGFTAYGYFLDTYKAVKGVAWVGDAGRAGKGLKELLKQITVEEYKELLPRYFAMPDKWIIEHGYDVARFIEKINVLRAPAVEIKLKDGWEIIKGIRFNDKLCMINNTHYENPPEYLEAKNRRL
jgi:hypothetical protein